METRSRYQSDLTNAQWAQVARFVPPPKTGGRPATHDRREIVNALLYLVRYGCSWRMLPHDLPPYRIVYWYFMIWKKDGTFDRLLDEPRGNLRQAEGAFGGDPRQPIGQDDRKGGPRGYDSGKKFSGRKRHIVVDTLGLILAVVVHPADVQDRDGAKLVVHHG
jgi:transposase